MCCMTFHVIHKISEMFLIDRTRPTVLTPLRLLLLKNRLKEYADVEKKVPTVRSLVAVATVDV